MAKAKRVVKSKEQVLAEMKRNEQFIKKMKFVRESLWPQLLDSTKSIDDAKMLLASFNNVMMEKFLGVMKEKNFKELNLKDVLDSKDDFYDKYVELLALFDDMSVYDAKDYLEGMRQEIDVFLTDEMKTRPLSSLKTKWIDQL